MDGPAASAELARFDLASALAVLSAASVSPTAAHRQPSISAVTAALHQRRQDGQTVATADHLPELLAAGAKGLAYGGLESDEPLDPRLNVSARWGIGIFRLAPGGWERPISIIEEAKLACSALDRSLDQRLGFRLRDLVELALRYMDKVLGLLSEAWPTGDTNLGAARRRKASITQGEIAIASQTATIDSICAECSDPARAIQALRWASCKPEELRAEPEGQSGVFGPVLAVRKGETFEALPVGFMLDGIYSAVETLTSFALEEQSARAEWERVCRLRVLHLIAGRGGPLADDVEVEHGQILALQPIRDGVLLAVDIAVVGLEQLGIEQAENRLRSVAPGAMVRTPRGEFTIADDEVVIRLLVVAGAASLAIFHGDDELPVNVIPAEDLRWIIISLQRVDDLALFLLDCQTPSPERRFSFGPFDQWEVWQGNGGAFHRLGAPLTTLVFDPHHERAEWKRHAELAWLEQGLLILGLSGLCSWPEVNLDKAGDKAATLIDLPRDTALDIAVLENGSVIGVRYAVRTAGEVRPASIGRAIFWKLRRLGESVSLLATSDYDTSIRIDVSTNTDPSAASVQVHHNGAGFVVDFDDRIQEELGSNSAQVESRIGRLLAETSGRPTSEQSAFASAWDAAPAGIAVDAVSLPQQARNPGPFVEPHGSFQARIQRSTAERLMRDGVSPGMRRSMAARDLESKQIHPVLMVLFHENVAPFNYEAVLRATLEDLERAYSERWRTEGHHARLASLAMTDVTERVTTSRRDSTVAWRSLALTAEEILRTPPTGNRVPRFLDLQRIYATAYQLFESGMRSETVHQAVSGTEIEITDGFELIARSTDIDFDFDAFNSAGTVVTFPKRPGQSDTDENDADDDEPQSIVQRLPELTRIDAALLQELGFGFDALLGVLDTVIQWPVHDREPIVAVPPSTLLDEAVDCIGFARDEFEAAMNWLTLRASDLRGEPLEHWELDRRAVRLATRPFVEISQGRVLLCPWGASTTRTIVGNHLMDGRLPWPQSALPNAVNEALTAYRSARNVDLERQVIATLRECPHLRVRGPIKKAKVLGLKTLPREIDGICVDEARSRIWVIEAKDRAVAFSPQQLRTAIDQFHEENGYIDKVVANVGIIDNNASTVAAAMGALNSDRAWQVIGLMATRRIEPAAYVAEPRLVFCTADTVVQTIDCDTVPHSRYAPISAGSN